MKVTYNGNVLTLPAGTTVEAAREVLKGIYPEIATATVKTTADGIEFVVQAGTKGSDLVVVYNGSRLSLPEGTTIEAAREVLKGIYPEIATADAAINAAGELVFTVKAGTKGADLVVVYNGSRLSLPEGTTIEAAREVLKGIYPEIATADAAINAAGELVFTVKAGTKGN